MATYIQGLSDYIPEVQPFRPDFNFYASALQTKQSQYEAGYQKLSSIYGSLLNSPMSRDSNIARRDEYFKAADDSIKKISGLDLSLQENVEQAYQVFKPFYEDPYMVKDMVWTKQYNNELGRAENFRNCIDEKKCGGKYWDTGVAALNYKMEEFRNSSDDQSLQFNSPRFTPFVNMTQKALEAAKEAGFNVKVDSRRGGYIVTTKNGAALLGSGTKNDPGILPSFFTNLFGSDPAIMDTFKTQAYVNRKNFERENLDIYGGDPIATNQAYMQQFLTGVVPAQKRLQTNANKDHDTLLSRKQAYDEIIERDGVVPGSDEHKAYLDLNEELGIATGNKEFYGQVGDLIDSIGNASNITMMQDRVDDIVARSLFGAEVKQAANTFAYMNYEETIQADPYALASYTSSLSLRNSLTLKQEDLKGDLIKEGYSLEEAGKIMSGQLAAYKKNNPHGTFEDNTTMAVIKSGATTGTDVKYETLQVNEQERNRLYGERWNEEKTFLQQMAERLSTAWTVAKNSTNGAAQMKQIVDAADQVFKGLGISGNEVVSGAASGKIEKAPWQGGTGVVGAAYAKALEIANPNSNSPWRELNKSWSKDFWDDTEQMRQGIQDREVMVSEHDQFYKENSKKVLNLLKAEQTGKNKDKKVESLNNFLAPDGRRKTVKEFQEWYYNEHKNDPEVLNQEINIYDPQVYGQPGTQIGTQPLTVKTGPAVVRIKRGQSPEKVREFLYAAAQKEHKELDFAYKDKYLNHGNAFNGILAYENRGKGGGLTVQGRQFTADSASPLSGNTMNLMTVVKDIERLEGEPGKIRFGYGNATELPEVGDNSGAKTILKALIADFKAGPKGKGDDPNRALPTVTYQDIAAGSDEWTAVTFSFNEGWAQNRGLGKEKSPIPQTEGTGKWREDVVVYIPKADAQNIFRRTSDLTPEQVILDRGKPLEVSVAGGGKVVYKKIAEGKFSVNTYIDVYKDGQRVEQVYDSNVMSGTFSAKDLRDNAQAMMKAVSRNNQAQVDEYRRNNSVRNPQQLLPSAGTR